MSKAKKKLEEEIGKLKREQKTLVRQEGGKSEQYFAAEDTITMLGQDLATIRRQEERNREMIKAKKEEKKKLINREVGTLKAMADDEGKDSARYRDAAKDSPLPTMAKLLFNLASEEQAHEQRLRMLAVELERGIL